MPRNTRIGTILAGLLLALVGIDPAGADLFLLNSGHGPPLATDQQDGFVDVLEVAAFGSLGHEVAIERVPAERSLLNVDRGIDDGNGPRISGLSQVYPNIRQVPEPVMTYDFVVFARPGIDFEPSDWSSLQPYNVAIINGWKILEKNVVGTQSLTKVGSPDQLFELLNQHRVDVVVFERWEGLHMMATLGVEGIQLLEPPLAQREMYLYLNVRHEQLVEQVAEALRQLKQDGTYQRAFDEILRPLEDK